MVDQPRLSSVPVILVSAAVVLRPWGRVLLRPWGRVLLMLWGTMRLRSTILRRIVLFGCRVIFRLCVRLGRGMVLRL